MEPLLTLLATQARDTLVDETGTVLSTQEGGPALFLRSVFDNLNIDYNFLTPERMEVEVLITPNDEFGRMKTPVSPLVIDGASITTPALVISTILDEVALEPLSNYAGQVFLDIQGYVRNGNEFGKKKFWEASEAVSRLIFCLKATEVELKFLPESFVEAQKEKILLVTKGERGCDVYSCGNAFSVVPSKAVKAENTIGAGDTYFAAFIAEYLKTEDPELSARVAQKTVEEFLQKKEG